MKVEVITPNETLFAGEAKLLTLPGTLGTFQILNNHAPIISTLSEGIIKIEDNQKQVQQFNIKSGLVEASNNHVSILVEV
jgi:F-type H+-transporting ATPase subunit epsilon